MSDYVFFLGSHPYLSELEIQKVLGNTCTLETLSTPLPLCVAKCSAEIPDTTFDRLGGTDRIGIALGKQSRPYTAQDLLTLLAPPTSPRLRGAGLPRKWMVGINVVEKNFSLDSFAFEMKTLAQAAGSKLKFVLSKDEDSLLNSAQVIFNRLDQAPNAELTLLPVSDGWLAVKTIWIQDIRAYELRDTARPARSAAVGMLPPKLAQIMINAAIGDKVQATIIDSFCGMGTIIQEGQLMGYQMVGSDNSEEMVAATAQNLAWLAEHFDVSGDPIPKIFLHNAQNPFPKNMAGAVDAVATEPYLGPPRRSPLPSGENDQIFTKLAKLYHKAFENFRPVLKPQGQVVFLLPAFAQRRGRDFTFFPPGPLDSIVKLGYRRVHPFGSQLRLLYARPDAWVGRELTLWERL